MNFKDLCLLVTVCTLGIQFFKHFFRIKKPVTLFDETFCLEPKKAFFLLFAQKIPRALLNEICLKMLLLPKIFLFFRSGNK